MKESTKKRIFRFLRILAKTFAGLLIFLLLLILFIRSPWGQNLIVDKLVASLSEKTSTRINVERLFITFSGNIALDGVYLEDRKGDTLIYSKSLEADIPLWPIIRGRGISVDYLEWKGVKARITRRDSLEGYNFAFLMDALAPADTTTADTSAAASQQFHLGTVLLSDFHLEFEDHVLGIQAGGDLGNLRLQMQQIDLEAMEFNIKVASLADSEFRYLQTRPFPEEEETKDPVKALFSAASISMNNVRTMYRSQPDSLAFEAAIGAFSTDIPKIDLAAKDFHIGALFLGQSRFSLEIQKALQDSSASSAMEAKEFPWPPLKLRLNSLVLENNQFRYRENDLQVQEGQFDPGALDIEEFGLMAKNIILDESQAGLEVEQLHFVEASGLDLQEFSGNFSLDQQSAELSALDLQWNQQELQGEMVVGYNSLEDLMSLADNLSFEMALSSIRLDPAALFRFQPELSNNEILQSFSSSFLSGQLYASGSLSNLRLASLDLSWGRSRLQASGTITHVMDPDRLGFHLPEISLRSGAGDLHRLFEKDSLGIHLPETLELQGNLQGGLDQMSALVTVNSSSGNLELEGNFQSGTPLDFDATLRTSDLDLGMLLDNPDLGALSLRLQTTGAGKDLNSLDADLKATITSFEHKGYQISDLEISGTMENGRGTLVSAYRDDFLDMELQALVQLDSIAPELELHLDLKGADFQGLGLSTRNIRGALKLDTWFKGNTEAYDVQARITEAIAVYQEEAYFPGDMTIDAHVRPDSTALHMANRLLDLNLESNADPLAFFQALERHSRSYLEDVSLDTLSSPVNLKIRGTIREAPVLTEVFIPGLEQLDTISLSVDFAEKEQSLKARMDLPGIQYGSIMIDSLSLALDSDPEHFDIALGFHALEGGPILVKKTLLEGRMEDQRLFLHFNAMDEEELLVNIRSQISREEGNYSVFIDPSELVLNRNPWDISPSNILTFTQDNMEFTDFILSRNNQKIHLDNLSGGTEKTHIALNFTDFDLSSILSYFNPESSLAKGNLNGKLVIEEPYGRTAMLGEMRINDFEVMEAPLGIVHLKAGAQGGANYNFDLSLKEGEVDLDLTGHYLADPTAASLDLDLQLNRMELKAVERFSQGMIRNSNGYISGEMTIGGTTAEPEYSGTFQFNEAVFNLASLNADFRLQEERLRLDNQGVYFEDFTLRDPENHSLVVNGNILTKTLLNPTFDLRLNAENFNALNSTREDNELFYGKANFDAKATLTGDLQVPQVDGRITINAETDLTYIMPEAELEMMERDGIVRFVNREDPEDLLTGGSKEKAARISGLIVNALIEIEDNAVFTFIINDQTGDNFRVSGRGELTFVSTANGRMNLSGRYLMNSGHYEMNLYDLVNRRFEIVAGSSISWSGDPLEASLDVRTVYRVETPASGLMASRSLGATGDGRFRQKLPFLVYLNVDGELTQPVLSFDLDMPEEEQGAIGGQVYGRIQQLNQQEDELQKQVFSLLVLNRFFPAGGSDGSQGGTMAIARDNLNQALSDQLNRFSDQVFGESGIELDFGVDSFTDYQGESPQERTQVDITARKRLMEDRLIVSVGSEVDVQGSNPTGETNPLIGNLSLEYLLNESGQLRLKGFRRNMYENVIDGQVIVSGIALIFTREFNKFKELWLQLFNQAQEDEDHEEK